MYFVGVPYQCHKANNVLFKFIILRFANLHLPTPY
jgi:hypothetical protein